MSSEFEDRIIDIGLEEVVGDASPPDLTARILDAAAGSKGDVASAPPLDPTPPRRRRPFSTPFARLSIAAAMLVAVSLTALIVWRGGSSDRSDGDDRAGAGAGANTEATVAATTPDREPDRKDLIDPTTGQAGGTDSAAIARSDTTLRVLRGADFEEFESRDLESGDYLAYSGDGTAVIEFVDGSIWELTGNAIARIGAASGMTNGESSSRFDTDEFGNVVVRTTARTELITGEMTVISAGRELTVVLPTGTVLLEPRSRCELGVVPYADGPDVAPWMKKAGKKSIDLARKSWKDAYVRSLAGTITGRFFERATALEPGEELVVWFGQDPMHRRSLGAEVRDELDATLTSIHVPPGLRPGTEDHRRFVEEAEQALSRLRAELGDSTAAWDHVRPTLLALLDSVEDRRFIYGLLLDDPHPWVNGMLQMDNDPEMWDPDLLMKLATRDVKGAMKRLGTWVRARSPEFEQQVYAALFLAIRGDDAGKRVFRQGVEDKAMFLRDTNAYFACAAGLAILGRDEAWQRGLRYLREELDRVRPRDGVEPTPMRVLRASYFHRTLDDEAIARNVDLTDMDSPVIEFIEERLATHGDHGALAAEIDRLSLE